MSAAVSDADRWHNALADLADKFQELFDNDSTPGYKKWDAARLLVEEKITETEKAISEANWEPDERAEGSDEAGTNLSPDAPEAPGGKL